MVPGTADAFRATWMLPAAKCCRVAAFPRQVRQRQKPGQARTQPSLSPAEPQPCCPCPHRAVPIPITAQAEPSPRDHCGTARECSKIHPGCSLEQTRSRAQPPAPQAQTSAGPRVLFNPLPTCTSEPSPPHPQKRGSQRQRGTARSPPQRCESSTEGPEAPRTKKQR